MRRASLATTLYDRRKPCHPRSASTRSCSGSHGAVSSFWLSQVYLVTSLPSDPFTRSSYSTSRLPSRLSHSGRAGFATCCRRRRCCCVLAQSVHPSDRPSGCVRLSEALQDVVVKALRVLHAGRRRMSRCETPGGGNWDDSCSANHKGLMLAFSRKADSESTKDTMVAVAANAAARTKSHAVHAERE